MGKITWTCHACSQERPDEMIAVASVSWRSQLGVSGKVNQRYCSDRPRCQATALAKAEQIAKEMEAP